MFQNTKPVFYAHNARFAGKMSANAVAATGHVPAAQFAALADAEPFIEDDAELRPMDWSELTSRLSAARDLRRVLHREAGRKFAAQSGGFAEAAARYFRTKDNDEQGVNLVALEQGKGSSCMKPEQKLGHAAEAMREIQ